MLRTQLGDDAFFRGLRAYYKAHEGATANSDDLRIALEKAAGKNLKQFFAEWVFGSGHPVYEWEIVSTTSSNGRATFLVRISQKQSGDAFLDPVTVEVTSGGAKIRRTIQPASKDATIEFSLAGLPSEWRFDPDEVLLKEAVRIIR
jgi:aminopeptidase N